MAMYITQKNRPEDQEFNENCTKQAVILELDPKKIKDNAELVCKAISRALLFFQNRIIQIPKCISNFGFTGLPI